MTHGKDAPTTTGECRQDDEFMGHSSHPGVGRIDIANASRTGSPARREAWPRCPNSGSEQAVAGPENHVLELRWARSPLLLAGAGLVIGVLRTSLWSWCSSSLIRPRQSPSV